MTVLACRGCSSAAAFLVLESGAVPLHGQREIEQAVERVAALKGGYIAGPRRLYQNRDLVLLIGDGVINVARRGRDGSWRFVISLLDPGMGRVAGKSTGVGSFERA